MGLLLKLAWRNLWRNRRRTIIALASIGLSLSLATFFVAMAEGMYAKLVDDAVRMQAGHLTLEHPDYRDAPAIDLTVPVAPALRAQIERLASVEATKALVVGQGIARSSLNAVGVAVIGVEPHSERDSSPLARKIVAGAYLSGDDGREAVVGAELALQLRLENRTEAGRLLDLLEPLRAAIRCDREVLDRAIRIQLALGKKLVLSSSDTSGAVVEELVRVRGVFETGAVEIDGFFVQVPIDFARKLYGLAPDRATELGILLRDPAAGARAKAEIQAAVAAQGVTVRTWREVLPNLAAYIQVDRGSNLVFQGILLFLVLFTIFNTLLMSVLERRREFAVVLALGTPPGRLKGQVLLESALLGLMGVGLGLSVGGLGAYALKVYGLDLRDFYEAGMSVSGVAVDPILRAEVTPGLLVGLGGITFLSTLLLALYPMGRIRHIPVAQVLR